MFITICNAIWFQIISSNVLTIQTKYRGYTAVSKGEKYKANTHTNTGCKVQETISFTYKTIQISRVNVIC